jgi:hypothetical protein
VVQHAVQLGDLSVLVADNGEIELGAIRLELVDVLDPALVRGDVVGRQADELEQRVSAGRSRAKEGETHLDASGLEIGVRERDGRELSGAHGCLPYRLSVQHEVWGWRYSRSRLGGRRGLPKSP